MQEILNDDLVTTWREERAITAAENRRKAAWKVKLVRAEKTAKERTPADDGEAELKLAGWEEFERDGLLR